MLFSFWYFWFGLGTLSSYLIPIAWVVLLLLSFTNNLSLIIPSDFFTLDYIYRFFPHSWLKIMSKCRDMVPPSEQTCVHFPESLLLKTQRTNSTVIRS